MSRRNALKPKSPTSSPSPMRLLAACPTAQRPASLRAGRLDEPLPPSRPRGFPAPYPTCIVGVVVVIRGAPVHASEGAMSLDPSIDKECRFPCAEGCEPVSERDAELARGRRRPSPVFKSAPRLHERWCTTGCSFAPRSGWKRPSAFASGLLPTHDGPDRMISHRLLLRSSDKPYVREISGGSIPTL
jgi:hypothetical protein